MLGAECEYGRDTSKDEDYRPNRPHDPNEKVFGKSYLAFDFRREYLVIKSKLKRSQEGLPPALRPIDAELSFDDIASKGIQIEVTGNRRLDQHGEGFLQEVIVTVCIRRPPKFYTEFEEIDKLPQMRKHGNQPYRRRATAMDFTIGRVVSPPDPPLINRPNETQERYERSRRVHAAM
jgi:RNA-dependent RNA polymerase